MHQKLTAFAVFYCLSIIKGLTAQQPLVKYVTHDPNVMHRNAYGSFEGGLKLYVHGANFKALSSQVMIGTTACIQDKGDALITATKIVCEVPKMAIGKYDVKVIVPSSTGNLISTCEGGVDACKLNIQNDYTPKINWFLPVTMPPWSDMDIYGVYYTQDERKIRFEIGDQNWCNSTDFMVPWHRTHPRWSHSYENCTVLEQAPGYYSFRILADERGYGQNKAKLNMQRFGKDGKKYNIIVAPIIDSISASKLGVSPQGQLLTIKGMGFSKILSQNSVMVMTHACVIQSATFFQITCKLPAFNPIADASFIGGRGLKRYFWNQTRRSHDDLMANVTPTTVETTFDSQGPKNIGYSYYNVKRQRFEKRSFEYRDFWTGLFKAPVTGNYKFMLSADDNAHFYMDTTDPWVKTKATYNPTKRAEVTYALHFQEFYRTTSQVSADIALEAGKYYYMELRHQEGSGSDHVTLGVQVPNTEDFFPVNHVYGIQKIFLETNYTAEAFQVAIWNHGAGSKYKFQLKYIDPATGDISKQYNSHEYPVSGSCTHFTWTMHQMALYGSCKVVKLDKNGVEIAAGAATEVKGWRFTYTLTWYREDRQLPFLVKNNLKGFAKSEVKRITKGTAGLTGTFTIKIGDEEVTMKHDEHPDHLRTNISALTAINSEQLVVTRSGHPSWGCTWTIEFNGLTTKPVITEKSLTGLTKDPNVTLTFNVTEVQAVSKNYLYIPISSDFLYTMETKPTVQVTTNGVLGGCRFFNCDINIDPTQTPTLTAYTYTPEPTLALTLNTPKPVAQPAVVVGDTLADSIFTALNTLRQDPASWVTKLQGYKAKFDGKKVLYNGVNYTTTEGTAAVDKAITFLQGKTQTAVLAREAGLNLACSRHVGDLGPRGASSEFGNDGLSPLERMEMFGQWQTDAQESIYYGHAVDAEFVLFGLLVDDGNANRPNRDRLFTAAFTKVGLATGTHKSKTKMAVLNFAVLYTSMSQPTPAPIKVPGYPWTQDEVTVRFMGSPCSITTFTAGETTLEIVCNIPVNAANANKAVAVAGDHFPEVHFAGVGYALRDGSLTATSLVPVVSLGDITGAPSGGTVLTIPGYNFGFSLTDSYGTGVTIGGQTCVLQSLTNTEIKCRTASGAANTSLVLIVNGKTVTDDTHYTTSNGPALASFSPLTASPVISTEITLTGTNFGTLALTNYQVTFIRTTTPAKEIICTPTAVTDTEIKCKLPGGKMGAYKIQLFKVGFGFAASTAGNFNFKLSITAFTPSQGSTQGGTPIVITGVNFSPVKLQNQIMLGTGYCTITAATTTQINCVTPDSTTALTNTGLIVPTNTGNATDPKVELAMLGRIVEIATCDLTAPGATCHFKYLESETPTITACSGNTAIAAGETVTVAGTLGAADLKTALADLTATVAGVAVTITADGAGTGFTFPMPTLVSGTYKVQVVHATKGNAKNTHTMKNTLKITSISPKTGSKHGTRITVTGNGFPATGVKIMFGADKFCNILTNTPNQIVCISDTVTTEAMVQMSMKIGETDHACATLTDCQFTTVAAPTITGNAQKTTRRFLATVTPTAGNFDLDVDGTAFGTDAGNTKVYLTDTANMHTAVKTYTGVTQACTATKITARFTGVSAGTYTAYVEVHQLGFAAPTSGVKDDVTVALVAASVGTTSSFAGGNGLVLTGFGFHADTKITVCGQPCVIAKTADATHTQVTCQTPQIVSLSTNTAYTLATVGPVHSQAATYSDKNNLVLSDRVKTEDISTFYDSSTAVCFVGYDFGTTHQAEIHTIKYFLRMGSESENFRGTVIETSDDGTTYTALQTVQEVMDGWNFYQAGDIKPKARFVRLRSTSTSKCQFASIEVEGIVLLTTDIADTSSYKCEAKVKQRDSNEITIADAVDYRADKTAKITEISPSSGTTAGGTVITIKGTNFFATQQNTKVIIDGIDCPVSAVSTAQTPHTITCTTGARPTFTPSSFVVDLAAGGYAATQGLLYTYIDRWSSPTTWGGESPPREGDSVFIPPGQNILMDMSTPKLFAVILQNSRLIFDDTADYTFDAEYIMVNEGHIIIGTEAAPHQHKLTLTFHGQQTAKQLPIYGHKGIFIRYGTLDIHGKTRTKTWTQLSQTADVGATQIVTKEAVDWVAGEKIIITVHNFDHRMSEERTITAAATANGKTTLTFAEPLLNKHIAQDIQISAQWTQHIAVEVGLLTRNVKIQGAADSEAFEYGCHVMMHSPGDESTIARIEYAEFYRCGQAASMGRYPIHFHMIGRVTKSYVKGNAIHHSYNRAITMHGIHYLRVIENVAYHIAGHTYFMEDGIETKNQILRNLAIGTYAAFGMLDTDQMPASYWITNPDNIYIGNHAAGSDHCNFWFKLDAHPSGPSATKSVCPNGVKLGTFKDNVAHSATRYGLRVFPQYAPRTNPCQPYYKSCQDDNYAHNEPIFAEFKDFLAYKNGFSGVITENSGAVSIRNVTSIENAESSIEISTSDLSRDNYARIIDCKIVGMVPDLFEAQPGHKHIGVVTSREEGMLISGVHFYNYNHGNEKYYCIQTCSKCDDCKPGGRTVSVTGLKFTNVTSFVRFNSPHRFVIEDMDGSLTGEQTCGWIIPYYKHNLVAPDCVDKRWNFGGIVCNCNVKVRKIQISGLSPSNNVEMRILRITDTKNHTNAKPSEWSNIFFQVQWNIPFVLGQTYNIQHRTGIDFQWLSIIPAITFKVDDPVTYFQFNHTTDRELFRVHVKDSCQADKVLTTQDSKALLGQGDLTCGAFHHDTANKLVTLQIDGKRNQKRNPTTYKIQGIHSLAPPPVVTQTVVQEATNRLWCNIKMWEGQFDHVPIDGESVIIPAAWRVVVNCDTSKLTNLEVKGTLIIPQNSTNGVTINAEQIWFSGNGKIIVGTEDVLTLQKDEEPEAIFESPLTINCQGNSTNSSFAITALYETGRNLIAATNNFKIVGKAVDTPNTILVKPGNIGDKVITVQQAKGWEIGAEIVITTTSGDFKAHDKHRIVNVTGNQVTLVNPLVHYHWGAADQNDTAYGRIDMRAAVLYLKRNVQIKCRVQPFNYNDGSQDMEGSIHLENIEMTECGTAESYTGCLVFQMVKKPTSLSTVKGCAIHDGKSLGMYAKYAKYLNIEKNVFHGFIEHSIKIEATSNINFTKNFISYSESRYVKSASPPQNEAFSFNKQLPVSSRKGIRITDNRMYGYIDLGWSVTSGPCDTDIKETTVDAKYGSATTVTGAQSGDFIFQNNFALGGKYGLVIQPWDTKCTQLTNFQAAKNKCGVLQIVDTAHFLVRNVILSDNKLSIFTTVGIAQIPRVEISHSSIFGLGQVSCDNCIKNGAWGGSQCTNNTGITLGAAYPGLSADTHMVMWPPTAHDDDELHPAFKEGEFIVRKVELQNFNDNGKCTGNSALQTNEDNSDNSPVWNFKQITKKNVSPNNLIRFYNPKPVWLTYRVGNCRIIQCNGPYNVMVKDLDGTILSKPGTIIGNNSKAANGTCKRNDAWNGFECPNAYATKFEWGIVAFEVLNWQKDLFRPFIINATNFYNNVTPNIDNRQEIYDISGERFPRYQSVIKLNQAYNLSNIGRKPKVWKWQLQSAEDKDYVVFSINYGIAQSLKVTKNGKQITPVIAKSEDPDVVAASLGTSCGNNVFVDNNKVIKFVLTGESDCIIQIEQIKSVQLNMKIEMDLDTFYSTDGPTLFVDKMAAFLGIPNDKLRIVSITKGSVQIKYEIILDEETQASSTIQSMTAAASSGEDGEAKKDADPCGGVSSGIASAISSGALDFGGQVSEMSYACSTPVEDDTQFAKAEKKQEEAEKNGGSGGTAAPLIIEPVKDKNSSGTSIVNKTKTVLDETDRQIGQGVFGVVLVFSVIVFIVVVMYQYEMWCFKRRIKPNQLENAKVKKFKTFSNKISMFDQSEEPAKEKVKPKVILVKHVEAQISSPSDQGTNRDLIKVKTTSYPGSKPVIQIDDDMNNLSSDSQEEQTPMILQENEKENFTAMLPGEELLQNKQTEKTDENKLQPTVRAKELNVEKSPEVVTKTLDFVYNNKVKTDDQQNEKDISEDDQEELDDQSEQSEKEEEEKSEDNLTEEDEDEVSVDSTDKKIMLIM